MPRKKIIVNRRQEILKAAERLFNHYGYEKTTMEDISREAGIPRATVYLEFSRGKEDILMANIAIYLDERLLEMKKIIQESPKPRLETLKDALVYCTLCSYDKASNKYNPDNLEKFSKRVNQEMGEFFQRRNQFFLEVLEQAALAHEIAPNLNLRHFVQVLAQALLAWMPVNTVQQPRDTVEQNTNTFFSLLLTGIANASNSNPNASLHQNLVH